MKHSSWLAKARSPGWFALLWAAMVVCATAEPVAAPKSPEELFQPTNVWTVQLRFTAEQWEAIEPKQEGRGGFGAPGGPGGPGRFGPGMFLAPAFLKGDGNQDGQLSKDEFQALGEKWFTQWDTNHNGKLNVEQVREGLNSLAVMPGFGPPGGGMPRGPGPNLQGSNGRNGLAAAVGIDFQYVHADLELEGQTLKDVAVRYKGNNTFMEARNTYKRSLKLDLNKYVKGQKLAGVTKFNLHNNINDAGWMNEVLSYRLFRDAGVPSPRTSYARVYVTVSGKFDKKYFGLYSMVEDIDGHLAQDRFGTKKGAIFKPVTRDLFAYLGDDWNKYEQTYEPKTELSPGQQNRIIEFAKLVSESSDADFAAKLGDYLDLDEFARFMSVTVWLSNLDSILAMGQNFYLYLHPETKRFAFLPWDLDHSFGQFPMAGSQEEREKLSIEKPWQGTNHFLQRVFKVEAFKTLYLAKLREFSKTVFIPDRFYRQVDEIAAAIRPAVKEESEGSLSRFEKVAAGEAVEHQRFGGNQPGHGSGADDRDNRPQFGGPGRFMAAAKPIKPFVTARAQSVEDQLAGRSEGLTTGEPGFGRGGGRRQGPGGFGPGMLSRVFIEALDVNKDELISHEEFTNGFAKWFEAWDVNKTGKLTADQLRAGINQDLAPFQGRPPAGENFGPPDGPPPFGP
jgi:spore coat protein CotH